MDNKKQKDTLTDLIEVGKKPIAENERDDLKEGEALVGDGEIVTLGFDDKKFIKTIKRYLRAVRKRRKR